MRWESTLRPFMLRPRLSARCFMVNWSCTAAVFSLYLICGTSYAHFPFLHSVRYNFLFLCYSLSFSGPCLDIRSKEIVFYKAKRNQKNKIGYLEGNMQTNVSTFAMLYPFHFFSSYLSSVFNHLHSFYRSISSYQQHPWKHVGVW